MTLTEAGDAMHQALTSVPCGCLTAGLWPFRPKGTPDHTCRRCVVLAGWDEAKRGYVRGIDDLMPADGSEP